MKKQQQLFELSSAMMPRNLILSIKPQYAFKIIEGIKTVELRRKFPTENVKGGIAIIYASSPIQEIIGYALIKDVKKLSIPSIWKEFSKQACVTKQFFNSYFDNASEGFAIVLSQPVKLKKPINIKKLEKEYKFSAPQSYRYVSGKILEAVEI